MDARPGEPPLYPPSFPPAARGHTSVIYLYFRGDLEDGTLVFCRSVSEDRLRSGPVSRWGEPQARVAQWVRRVLQGQGPR